MKKILAFLLSAVLLFSMTTLAGAEDEDVQSVYQQLADGLYLAHDTRGDVIYTAFP